MHFCFVNMPIEYYSPVSGGAISTIIMQVSKELINLGHEVTVLTKKNSAETYNICEVVEIHAPDKTDLSIFERAKCKVLRKLESWDYPYYGLYLKSFSDALKSLKKTPDVVIVFNDLVSSRFIRRLIPKVKIGVWLQNYQRTRNPDLRKTIAATDCFLTCSSHIRDWAIETHQIPPAKIVSAASGVDTSIFFPRQDWLEPSEHGAVRCVYVGRIDPNKGPDIALNAVLHLTKDEGCALTFTIAGDVWFYANPGDERNAYRAKLLDGLKDLEQSSFLGHVPHSKIAEIFRDHDVAFVLTRLNEPFGLVSLEAMASGCAVIASNRGGLPEACGSAGILVDPDTQEEVNQALRKLYTDKTWLNEQKKRGLERAKLATWLKTAQIVNDAFLN